MTKRISKEYIDVATYSSAKIFQILVRGINPSYDFCITIRDAIEFQNILSKYSPSRLIRIASDRGYYNLRWFDENCFCVESCGDMFILSEECTCELHYLLGLAIGKLSPPPVAKQPTFFVTKECFDKMRKWENEDDPLSGARKRTNDNLRGVFE